MSVIQQVLLTFGAAADPPPGEVTRELTDSFSFSDNGTYTETGASFGTAAADRLIFVCISAVNVTDDTTTITAVTIGGVAATSASAVIRSSGSGFGVISQIWWAAVPSGTTGDIVITFTGVEVGGSAAVYKIRGANATPIASQNTGSVATGNVTAALTISNETACLATAQCGLNTTDTAITWTNITEDADLSIDIGVFVNSGFASRADTVGPGATTFTASPAAATVDDDKTMAAVEIAPA